MAREDDFCCCRSPQQEFTVSNNGSEPLANDTRTTVTLPAGIISRDGLTAISAYLRSSAFYHLHFALPELGDLWQTKEGNFAKRLGSYSYKVNNQKLPPEILSHVGTVARNHSTPVDVTVDVTRRLNLPPEDFCNSGSCWWDSYSESRCALKTNGGFGLRAFDEEHEVSGRAWVMPLRQQANGTLLPTFDTLTPDAFAVFNGYGSLNGYAAPRILAHLTTWAYQKIGFACHPMYVNSGGYLIAPENITKNYTSTGLRLSVRQHANLFTTEQENALRATNGS